MIGKTIHGKSFGGCVRYVMDKDHAEVLDQFGVRTNKTKATVQDFNMGRKQNPKVQKAVWHTSISFAYNDKINDDLMKKIGQDYLDKIGLTNNQYLMVKHNDTEHQHIHIVANRVDFNGQATNDTFSKNRTARIMDQLEQKYGLTVAREQKKIRQKLTDKVPTLMQVKERIREAINISLNKGVKTLDELRNALKKRSIETKLQVQKTGRVNGISFKKDKVAIKGSAIDRSFSYGRLNKKLQANQDKEKGMEL